GHSVSVSDTPLYLDGPDWLNNGALTVTNSDLFLGGEFVMTDLGSVTRSGTGSTHIIGTLDNSSQTLVLNSLIRDLYVDGGGVVQGGTIAQGAGHQVFGQSGYLDGVTLNAPISMINDGTIFIMNGLTLNSTMTLGSNALNSNGTIWFS